MSIDLTRAVSIPQALIRPGGLPGESISLKPKELENKEKQK